MGKFGKIINKIPRQFLSKLPYHTFFLYFFQNMHNSLTKSSRSVHKFSWSGRRKGAISLWILRHPFKLNCCFTVIIAISLIFVLFPPCHHSCEILFSFCAKFKLSCCFGFLCQNFAQIRGVRIRQYRQKFPPGRAGRARRTIRPIHFAFSFETQPRASAPCLFDDRAVWLSPGRRRADFPAKALLC